MNKSSSSPRCIEYQGIKSDDLGKEPFVKKVLRRLQSPRRRPRQPRQSLQQVADKLVSNRGYPTDRQESLKSSYCGKPTSYQKASFGERISDILQCSNIQALKTLLTAGISPNPYDAGAGEYLVHKVCQSGDWDILQVMLEYGGNDVVRSVDTFGRTPLHVLCMNWKANHPFSSVSKHPLVMLLECDRQLLFMTDCRNAEPLTYLESYCWDECIQILEGCEELLWPTDKVRTNEVVAVTSEHPSDDIALGKCTAEIAAMLSSGRMDPEEVSLLQYNHLYRPLDGTNNRVDKERTASDLTEKTPNSNPRNRLSILSPSKLPKTPLGVKKCFSPEVSDTESIEDYWNNVPDDDFSETEDSSFNADDGLHEILQNLELLDFTESSQI